MIQPERGLIPTLLDASAVEPEPIVSGTRLSECPYVTAEPRSFNLAAVEQTEKTVALTIGNEALESNEPLDWTITEAPLDCAAPSDVSWLSADVTEGTTPSAGGSATVAVTASTVGPRRRRCEPRCSA